jgi:pimeloyl-ACP methyl ester carboxylesterase
MSQPAASKWLTPAVRAEFVATEAADGVSLHGAFYVHAQERPHDVGVLLYHGSGANFYSGPPGFLAPALTARSYAALSMNLRDHGRFHEKSLFEPCELDIAAGVAYLRQRGFERIVIFGHSLSVTQVLYYLGRNPDPAVCGTALSGGHWDLAGDRWQSWNKLRPDHPRAGYEEMVAHCEELAASGRGDDLVIVPWWQPDPAKPSPEDYRPLAAKTFLAYYGPDSNCRASKWIGRVRVPVLIISHTVVDTFADPAMAEKLHAGATAAPFADLVEIQGSGHFYQGYEHQLVSVVADWIDKVRATAPAGVR